MKLNLSMKTIIEWIEILIIFSIMTTIGNYVGYNHPIQESLIGMFMLCIISLIV